MSRYRYVLHRDTAVTAAKERLVRAEHDDRQSSLIAATGAAQQPVRFAFYVGDTDGLSSLQDHASEITHLCPAWLTLGQNASSVVDTREHSDLENGRVLAISSDDRALAIARKYGIAVLPMLQNVVNGDFQSSLLHRMLNSPHKRRVIEQEVLSYVLTSGLQGVNIDLETDQSGDQDSLSAFVHEISADFHAHKLLVTQDIPLDNDAYDLASLCSSNDLLVPMLYDEHSSGGDPGPIASREWFSTELSGFLQHVPASKTVIGLANYAYDWRLGSTETTELTFQAAAQTAEESRDGSDGIIKTDPRSGNPYFTYYDDSAGQGQLEVPHVVWLEDAVCTYNQMIAAQPFHTRGAALWRLGDEDPSLWTFFGKDQSGETASFDPHQLSDVSFGYFGAEMLGQGDILSVVGSPTDGHRVLQVDPLSHRIISERFDQYPSQYVVRSTGLVDQSTGLNTQKIVALTFDDGPDPHWTPQILDILDHFDVKATFFVVGRNAETNPDLVEREWDDGMEIGNHSFTHPEMDSISPERTRLELDATQRVIEAITGHETLLFRAPNRADSEPSTEADLEPIRYSSQLGYIFVGEKIDPTDWLPGISAKDIADHVVASAQDGNCILLHDAGGDTRAQTIKALPEIIERLRAQGYRFVTVSKLTGRPKSQLFPLVPAAQRLVVLWDRLAFDSSYWLSLVLTWTFVLTILLGIGRITLFAVLSWVQSRQERARTFNKYYEPSVSVVIAAFNESKVITRTITTVLNSRYRYLEVVVVDDGSVDGTAEIVSARFGNDPRVTVLCKANGGKASALNEGIKISTGEIVVALDADTIFEPETITRLVRHFADPAIGAVSGNVRVGNRRNAWTWWQALEYSTSQNFDRRAFDLMNCITVVPGAVGAWRKDAVILAGLYSSQTLAEDTDLTFKVRRLGYRIVTDNTALAYTEAPETLHTLARQRFRWAYGTLQCLWKHRSAMFSPRYGAFGTVALPCLWVYQIGFQILAPLIDLAIVWSIFYGTVISPELGSANTLLLIKYWVLFTCFEATAALLALRLDNEDLRLLPWLPLQRFVYRQMMYYVILKSLITAATGARVGWGRQERRGTVSTHVSGSREPIGRHSP